MPKQQTVESPELIKLLGTINLSGHTVVRHGYRQYRVIGDAVIGRPIAYTDGDRIARLQHRLASAAGSRVDNHETYEVVTPDRQKLCLWFHDWRLVIGTAITPY